MLNKKRKILVPIFNRAHYGRLRSVLKAIKNHPELELQIITSVPAAYDNFFLNLRHSKPYYWPDAIRWYLRARWLSVLDKLAPGKIEKADFIMSKIVNEGYKIEKRVPMFIDGGSNISMAKIVGIGIMKLVDILEELKPDIVFVNADRFEMMAVALVAAYLNIPIAHNEGGDLSGTIDESIRHAITKLAHIHFAATEKSYKRLIQMGEDPKFVFKTGSPAVDNIKNLDLNQIPDFLKDYNYQNPSLLVLFNPVTTEKRSMNLELARTIIGAVEELAMPTIFLGSNVDARSCDVGQEIKKLIKKNLRFIKIVKTLPPDDFYLALAKTSCALGNSSSFIREACFFGTPAVLVGSRQQYREKGGNVMEVPINKEAIKRAVLNQLKHGRYEKDFKFGDGEAGKRIADILASAKPRVQKRFFEIIYPL